MTLRKP